MKEISTRIDIAASPDKVWRTLTDWGSLPAWSSFLRSISGRLVPGQRLQVEMNPRGDKRFMFRPKVLAATPGRELRWLGRVGLPGIFDGEHRFLLRPNQSGGTTLEHAERFSGMLVPFLGAMLSDTEAAFARFNRELKQRVEFG